MNFLTAVKNHRERLMGVRFMPKNGIERLASGVPHIEKLMAKTIQNINMPPSQDITLIS